MMKQTATLLMAGLLAFAGQGYAADATAVADEPTARDTQALDRLVAMGNYLRGLKAFGIHADTSLEQVLETGQKLQFAGTADYLAQPPNRLRIEITNDHQQRQYFYNGEALTQFAPRIGYYATVPATGTLGELVQHVKAKFDIDMPLADLFFWGTDKADPAKINSAAFIGVERIGGQASDHYAFREEGVDWQVWIQQGNQPLPLKLVITTLEDAAQPQYVAVLKWNLAPKLSNQAFNFTPPKKANKIELIPADTTAQTN
jgi:hypothetical protein